MKKLSIFYLQILCTEEATKDKNWREAIDVEIHAIQKDET